MTNAGSVGVPSFGISAEKDGFVEGGKATLIHEDKRNFKADSETKMGIETR